MKGRKQNLLMLVAVAALIFLLFSMNSKSGYTITEREYSPFGMAPSAGPAPGPSMAQSDTICGGMNKGTGLASSLLPREVASAEDFGQFAPEDISRSDFLEPACRLVPRDGRWCSPQRQPADPQGPPQPQRTFRVEQFHYRPRSHASWSLRLKI